MFLLFGGWIYHPKGGMNDYAGQFNTFIEAFNAADKGQTIENKTFEYEWWHIVEKETMQIVDQKVFVKYNHFSP